MHRFPLLSDEAERHAILGALNILNTGPEPVFDRITGLAARLFEVPIALFSLIDTKRQWFKSRIGIDVEHTPLEHALCAYAIAQSEPLVVADASQDARFCHNPAVTGPPHLRFYASVPVRATNGVAIGTLCVLDTAPRTMRKDELDTLVVLAGVLSQEIQYREQLSNAQDVVDRNDSVVASGVALFQSMFDLASIGMALIASDGRWEQVNGKLCDILGYPRSALQEMTLQDLVHPEDSRADTGFLTQLGSGDIGQCEFEKRYLRPDGSTVWLHLNMNSKRRVDNSIEYYVAVIRDITEQVNSRSEIASLHAGLESRIAARTHELLDLNRQLAEALSRQEQTQQASLERQVELTHVIDSAKDAYMCVDSQNIVVAWNRQAEQVFGWPAAEAIGKSLFDLTIPPDLAEMFKEDMARFADTGDSELLERTLELPARRKDGTIITVELQINILRVNGRTLFSSFMHDISARKAIEAQREFEARHDLLTGLQNRRALMETLPLARARVKRNHRSMALLFIDLDGFKSVNDTFGHSAGDELLRTVATRLARTIRGTDSAFRLAGDEFTVILEDLQAGEADAVQVAEKLVEAVSQAIRLEGAEVSVGASVGMALYHVGSTASDRELIEEADSWMYRAKRAGRGQVLPRQSGR